MRWDAMKDKWTHLVHEVKALGGIKKRGHSDTQVTTAVLRDKEKDGASGAHSKLSNSELGDASPTGGSVGLVDGVAWPPARADEEAARRPKVMSDDVEWPDKPKEESPDPNAEVAWKEAKQEQDPALDAIREAAAAAIKPSIEDRASGAAGEWNSEGSRVSSDASGDSDVAEGSKARGEQEKKRALGWPDDQGVAPSNWAARSTRRGESGDGEDGEGGE